MIYSTVEMYMRNSDRAQEQDIQVHLEGILEQTLIWALHFGIALKLCNSRNLLYHWSIRN